MKPPSVTPEPPRPRPFRVAIIGGGLAGLSLVLSLQKFCSDRDALSIDLYDAAATFTEVGAGITIWPRTVALLRELGIADGLHNLSVDEVAFRMRKGDQPEGYNFYDVRFPDGPPHRLLRADLQKRLLSRLRDGPGIHLARSLVGMQQNHDKVIDPVTLTFADGSTATCDLVVGADGVHSTVRRLAIEEECRRMTTKGVTYDTDLRELAASARAEWSGRFAYRGMANASALPSGHPSLHVPMRYVGADRQVITYPLSSKPAINVLTMVRAGGAPPNAQATQAPREEVVAAFAGWEPSVCQLLHAMNEGAATLPRWALLAVRPPRSYIFDRAVLVGDAAHAMLPYLGVGAGVAIDDGFALGRLLGAWVIGTRSHAKVEATLHAYEDLRGPLTREMHARSLASAEGLELGGAFDELRGKELGEQAPHLIELAKVLGETTREGNIWAGERCAESNMTSTSH
ncbi:hypothetical protein BD626DRAFT_565370 [Schizophyllum amplum]|uniref:FAD-binding domain-containing protein n=1 Tax=Schizophyllum amplum TaxID=97359 RepID=A0A550CUS9_9AGAR|nr:hypothetical protein BD626DRAFT_565370 [Auriculariopsis ampla]